MKNNGVASKHVNETEYEKVIIAPSQKNITIYFTLLMNLMKYSNLWEHNITINGHKALMYCFGLSSSRYIEYTAALNFLELKTGEKILDIGSGHSIFPSLLNIHGSYPFLVDVTRDCLIWQIEKARIRLNQKFDFALSSGEHLPFRNNSFHAVTAISVLEHFRHNGDIKCSEEIGRILKPNGICVVSVPATSADETIENTHWASGVPSIQRRFFGRSLRVIFKKFNVDRNGKYLMREYCFEDLMKRIVEPTTCILEDYLTMSSQKAKMIYNAILPPILTPLEYLLAKRFVYVGKSKKDIGGIILKLRKP